MGVSIIQTKDERDKQNLERQSPVHLKTKLRNFKAPADIVDWIIQEIFIYHLWPKHLKSQN